MTQSPSDHCPQPCSGSTSSPHRRLEGRLPLEADGEQRAVRLHLPAATASAVIVRSSLPAPVVVVTPGGVEPRIEADGTGGSIVTCVGLGGTVRIAIGARRRDVLRLVMGEGLGVCLIGLAVGLPAAWALSRVLASQLYETSHHDSAPYAIAALVLVASGLLACYLPACRAARIDPMEALRHE